MQNIELNDFYVAAYLIAAGFEMADIQKINRQSLFIFTPSDEIRKCIGDYYSLQATVNAATYAKEIRNLKSIIHNIHSDKKTENNEHGPKRQDL